MTLPTPTELPRLLKATSTRSTTVTLAAHVRAYGPLPHLSHRKRLSLIETTRQSGLLGRGGANFPLGAKLAAVATGRGAKVAVANGCEGEPAIGKDKFLLARAPHLVLDGLAVAASAVGARQVILATTAEVSAVVASAARERSRQAVDEHPVVVVTVPDRFISGEASALVNYLNGGPGLPTVSPPRPDERGVNGRPTLVSNVETLAHLALVARYGAQWFRAVGREDDPGSTLVTVRGAVRDPGVYEVARGTRLSEAVARAGGVTAPVQAVLLGGYGGTWLPAAAAWDASLSEAHLGPLGATLGAGLVFVFPEGRCGLAETARVLSYLARESAGQCGPCRNGLPAMAGAMAGLAGGTAPADVLERLKAWAWQVNGRGACRHPDGAARLAKSALETFVSDVASHKYQGGCWPYQETSGPWGPLVAGAAR